MSDWEWRTEVSTGGQAEEESTGGEDGQCDLEDELHYCGCCLCSICMLQRSKSDVYHRHCNAFQIGDMD
jgi:hypothetical protein